MKLRLFPIALALSACEAEPEVALWMEAEIDVPWDPAFDGAGDGLTALVPVDVLVYDGESGDPLEHVVVEIGVAAGMAEVESDVAYVAVDVASCVDCPFVWDAYGDRWVERLDGSDLWNHNRAFDGAEGRSVHSDADGLARFTLAIDAFPMESGEPAAAVFEVGVEGSVAELHVVPR